MGRIALVDDDRNILTSVSMALEAEGYEVDCYQDGFAALADFEKEMPALAVLDVKMPRIDGIDLLQRIRQKSDIPVIFLTSKDDEIDELLGLRLGADDYITKPFSQRLVLARIHVLLRRKEFLSTVTENNEARSASDAEEAIKKGNLLVCGDLTMDMQRHSVTWRGTAVTLTLTEFLLLHTLAQHPGYVKSRDQLMSQTYDSQVYVDDRTIDSHIKRLRKKMRSVDPEFNEIETLYGIGYRYRAI